MSEITQLAIDERHEAINDVAAVHIRVLEHRSDRVGSVPGGSLSQPAHTGKATSGLWWADGLRPRMSASVPFRRTTLALVGGMLPLALGSGPGAEERRAIAVVAVGGQSLSLFLTLVVIPIAYSLVESVRARRLQSAGARRDDVRTRANPQRPYGLKKPAPSMQNAECRMPNPEARCPACSGSFTARSRCERSSRARDR